MIVCKMGNLTLKVQSLTCVMSVPRPGDAIFADFLAKLTVFPRMPLQETRGYQVLLSEKSQIGGIRTQNPGFTETQLFTAARELICV